MYVCMYIFSLYKGFFNRRGCFGKPTVSVNVNFEAVRFQRLTSENFAITDNFLLKIERCRKSNIYRPSSSTLLERNTEIDEQI